jgi:hypothetical protein
MVGINVSETFMVYSFVLSPYPQNEFLCKAAILHLRLFQNFSFGTATLDLETHF